mgnify:CR=1 FL=1
MSKIYNMVFISPFGPIGVNSSNEVITELRFVQKIKQIKPTNSFFKEVYRQLELYFNNSKKVETTNTGAIVTGICTATSFSGSGENLTRTTPLSHRNLIINGQFLVWQRAASGVYDYNREKRQRQSQAIS